ncbi:NAD(P)/FAD-dependent oxidoreductase [Halomonas sp. M20]|uniref:NAD(P)/FAD-dependent oxidoreductase n=1 Tax=Halomonas sp. M20 TaxID=2763264 RepID=UPI001D0B41E7|nr:FAD-dependent oxidoreductase [Halomonas sp. M20]
MTASTSTSAASSTNRDEAVPDADIVVIGAGVVGVACALELSRRGRKVLVIDRESPGMGASFGNAGHMATEQVFPVADASLLWRIPGMLMDSTGPLRLDWRYLPKAAPWFMRLMWNMRAEPARRATAGLRTLNEASLAAWQSLLNDIGQARLLKTDGSLLVHEKPDTAEELEGVAKRMQAQGVPVERFPRDKVLATAPELTEAIQGALFFPDTAHVTNPYRLVEALARAAEQHGARFVQGDVKTGRVRDDGVHLETSTGSVTASRVLVACGAHSAPLVAALSGLRVPLDTERGYHLMLPREPHRLPMAVTSLERRFIMTPMEKGLRLAGTVEFAGLKRAPNMERAWQLERLAQGMFRRPLDSKGATPWMGFRPSLPDSLPVIDQVGPGKRLWLAFGHHHLGLTQAAVTARLVGSFLNEGSTANSSKPTARALPSLEPYRLLRFA